MGKNNNGKSWFENVREYGDEITSTNDQVQLKVGRKGGRSKKSGYKKSPQYDK